MGFSTDAIHAGQIPDPTTGAVITPIYQTSTYAQEELGKNKGFEYGRTHNLTRASLEQNIANLEKSIEPSTKIVFIETPTNPMLNLTDIKAVSDICRKNGLISVVDNTF